MVASASRRSGHGACAEQKLRSVFLLQLPQKIDCAGDGHGDFNDGDAAGDHGLDDGVCLRGGFGAQDGNEPDALDDFCVVSDIDLPYRAMRAEPPFMARSTSASVAMLVSPAVVMASAPWATPQRTAHSMGFPASKP